MLLIKNAHILDYETNMDILIDDSGKYLEIEQNIDDTPAGTEVIDAKGMLVAPTFVNTHMHFDKAYTALEGREDSTETLEDSISIMHDHIRAYTVDGVKERAIRAIHECVSYGTTKLRTNVDISNLDPDLIALQGVLLAKEETKDICDLQIVAFPQEGIIRSPGTAELMEKAMEMGCDIVGGMPAAEWLDEHKKQHVDFVFELAEKYHALIDMHIDQSKDAFDRSLEYTAWLTLTKGLAGRVTGGHCTSIAYQNQSHAIKVMKLIKEADMNICTNTQVLTIMGIDPEPATRGVTRIREMVEMGINIVTAQDTICDGFHLYGIGDPLDYGLLCAYTSQFNTPDTAKIIFDMVTRRSARVFDPDCQYGIKVGNDADLNIIDATSAHEALRLRASRPYVIRHGKVIAKYERKATLL